MISTGVVRKIDDLGRIVIPKEIRKSLGIRDGENLEILIEGNTIKLSKKNIINNYLNDVKEVVFLASSIITGSIIITDREKVIGSSKKEVLENMLLSNKLINFIDERLSFNDNKLESFNIGDLSLSGYFLIMPIISEGSALGLIIVYNETKQVSDYYLMVKFISIMLARKLDISC